VFNQQHLRPFAKRFLSFGIVLLIGASHASAARRPSALTQSRQMLIVTTPDWHSVAGTMQRYERHRAGQPWRKVGELIPVVVGKGGMGWGDGIVAVPGHTSTDPVKHEGDGRTPAGVFSVGATFGYALDKPAAWAIPYRPLTPATECVDDRDSKYYNQIVERTGVTPDWKSSEKMRSEGVYYQWGAVIEQNPKGRPGDGSCVFLHVWGGNGEGTSGCTAMAKPVLETVLGWLKPGGDPLVVEMPITEYRLAVKTLRLPSQ
jgi:L,D-peptidoglycan transpeptidase YkuD (ErfK/YbiS/YcfS/YnhG family)